MVINPDSLRKWASGPESEAEAPDEETGEEELSSHPLWDGVGPDADEDTLREFATWMAENEPEIWMAVEGFAVEVLSGDGEEMPAGDIEDAEQMMPELGEFDSEQRAAALEAVFAAVSAGEQDPDLVSAIGLAAARADLAELEEEDEEEAEEVEDEMIEGEEVLSG